MENNDNTFSGWVILELLGHRRLGGYVSEAQIAGASFLRIDIHNKEGLVLTQYCSPNSIYALTPTTEELARRMGEVNAPAPVHRFELPPIEREDDE